MRATAHYGAEVIPWTAAYLAYTKAHRDCHLAVSSIRDGLSCFTKSKRAEFLLEHPYFRSDAVLYFSLANQLLTQRIQDTEPAITAFSPKSISINGWVTQAQGLKSLLMHQLEPHGLASKL
ncbi:hypothetical protein ACX1DW_02085 [Stutzerimonas sp. KH-1]